MYSLSIIIPIYNEINYLNEFTNKLNLSFKNESAEFIFINDGSTDGSAEWLQRYYNNDLNNRSKLINFKMNQGKGKAVQEGLKISTGKYILFQDADLEINTQDSYEIYKIIKNDKDIECVFGSRYLSGKIKKNQNLLNEFIGKLNSILFNLLFNQSLSDVHCGTKIISRNVKNKLNLKINDFGLEIDIASQIAKQKIEIYEYGISYFPRNRSQGKKITWVDGVKSYYYLFKTRFIDNELSTQISIIFSAVYMAYVGSFFGMGIGKSMFIVFCVFAGLFIGLNRKICTSSIIFFFIYIGSLFSQGNGKIYTVLIGFFIGLYFSKKVSIFFKKNITKRKLSFLF